MSTLTVSRSALSYHLTMKELSVKVDLLVLSLSLHLSSASVLPPALTSSPRSEDTSAYQYSLSISHPASQQERNHQTGRRYSSVWLETAVPSFLSHNYLAVSFSHKMFQIGFLAFHIHEMFQKPLQ